MSSSSPDTAGKTTFSAKISKYFEGVRNDLRRDMGLYLMLLPVIVWFLLFHYLPIGGLQIAFKKYSLFKGIEGSPWIGFEHFITLFQSDQFLRAIGNTLMISFYSILFSFPMPILLAIMINEVQSKGYRKAVQTIVYLPHFISVVIVAGLVVSFLSPSSGVINNILAFFGFERIYFLTQPEWFRSIFVGSNIWKEAGFNSIVFL
jgi:putative aldouronate transport system permease protein